MQDRFYVYLISRPNGQPCYVGKGFGKRFTKHFWRTHNPHLANIIRNAGGQLPVRKIAEDLPESEAFELERFLIEEISREVNGGPLINQTNGGEGISGFIFPRDVVERLAKRNSGRTPWNKGRQACFSEETLLKMRLAKLGRAQSAEHKANIGAAHIGRTRDPGIGAKITAAKTGKKWSAENRAKLKAGNRSQDPEVRAKISAGLKSFYANRKVICASTNV